MSVVLPTTNEPLGWALAYYRLGWSLIPVNPETKKPRLKAWRRYQTERATEQQIREWFGRDGHSAMAVILGAVSGNLATLDFDSNETYEWFKATHPELAQTLPTEKTARGLHVFFRCEPTPTQRPKNQKIELLSTGAYVIVTPSPGKRWLNPPKGEISQIAPFTLGLERFGITKPEAEQPPSLTERGDHFTEREDSTLQRHRDTEMASVSLSNPPNSLSVKSSATLSVKSGQFGEKSRRAIDEAINETLPTCTSQRNSAIFDFCRALKSIPELCDAPLSDLRPVIERWHARALPVIGTKPFDETRADFEHAWEKVKWPKGTQLLPIAREMAVRNQDEPPEANAYEDPQTRLLVRICWQLQLLHGDQPFFLAWHSAGDLVGLSHPQAGRRLEMLVRDRVLKITEKNTVRRARRYKYIGGTDSATPDQNAPRPDPPAGRSTPRANPGPDLDAQAEAAADIEQHLAFIDSMEHAQPLTEELDL